MALLGVVDVATGFELSFSIFYLGPVALATWYGSRRVGILVALVGASMWYFADLTAGASYSHPAIPLWNALVRLGFFLITATLLAALRVRLEVQQRLARTDTLTGLLNRRAFEERLEIALAFAAREQRPLTLAYVDLDDFKRINDKHGHAAGDQALLAVARVLSGAVRRTDAVTRLGGDEFAILLTGADLAGARHLLEKTAQSLRHAARAPVPELTCSIGAVHFPTPPESAAAAIAAADALMYKVKQGGKNAVLLEAHTLPATEAPGSRREPAPRGAIGG